MPVVHRNQRNGSILFDELLMRLIKEWRQPDENAAEPIIIEESPAEQAPTNHLYVVWSEWATLSPIERSKLVLQAYAKVRGQELANSITLSMGLTPDDALRLNLPL